MANIGNFFDMAAHILELLTGSFMFHHVIEQLKLMGIPVDF